MGTYMLKRFVLAAVEMSHVIQGPQDDTTFGEAVYSFKEKKPDVR